MSKPCFTICYKKKNSLSITQSNLSVIEILKETLLMFEVYYLNLYFNN